MSDPYKYRHDHETYETPEAFQHVQDMTRFGLHSKSDIACELAGRDRCIAELERERDEANKTIEALEVKAHDLRLVLDGVAKERNELRELLREAADYLEEQPYWADELHICKRIRQIIAQDSGESES